MAGQIVTSSSKKKGQKVVKDWNPSDSSRGLGDTIAKLTHVTKLDLLAETYTRITGKDCGCAKRQTKLNKLVPYKKRK